MKNNSSQILENYQRVRQRIMEAAQRSGRQPDSVRMVGVTKYVGVDHAKALVETGCCDLGESRPQELWNKSAKLSVTNIRWHMIGHLQRNKVRRTLPLVEWIHAGDSLRLLKAVDDAAAELNRRTQILLEVNISGDVNKHGFNAEDVEAAMNSISQYEHLDVCGLMAMASASGGPDQARRDFSNLRELRDRLRRVSPPAIRLDELSMGMSHDFAEAILEGATMVRIGSALWEDTLV